MLPIPITAGWGVCNRRSGESDKRRDGLLLGLAMVAEQPDEWRIRTKRVQGIRKRFGATRLWRHLDNQLWKQHEPTVNPTAVHGGNRFQLNQQKRDRYQRRY